MDQIVHFFFEMRRSASTVACVGIDWSRRQEYWLAQALAGTSQDEQSQASRFRKPEDALRHLLGRALARRMLKAFHPALSLPNQLPLNQWGKPLSPAYGPHFSITHAASQVWLAWTQDAAVGIDLEPLNVELHPSDLMGYLHPRERAWLLNIPDGTLAGALLRCWCRKEAVIKAMGMGLSLPLESFAVSTQAMESGWLQKAPQGEADQWTCVDIATSPEYLLSIAAMAPGLRILYQVAD